MAKNLERYDKLVIVIIIIALLMLGIGYWFAQEKSEPVYRSKIDRLMFDKNNKSPAFLITLPDDLKAIAKATVDGNADFEQPQNSNKQEPAEEQVFSLEKLIKNIPSLSKLTSKNYPVTLKNIETLPDLSETDESGNILPKIDDKGHRPWTEYGQTIQTQPNFKKVAIIIGNLGFDSDAVAKISSSFDPAVSLSFHPYTTHDGIDILTARQKGHETYRELILASTDYLREDTGPLALNFDLSLEELFSRFYKSISQTHPIGGVVIRDGLLRGSDTPKIIAILEKLRDRGLLMIDATNSEVINSIKINGLPRRKADIVLTNDMKPDEIEAQIKKAENIAFSKGQVLIVSENKPLPIVMLNQWIDTFSPQLSYEESKTANLTKPFALVPVSNLVVE